MGNANTATKVKGEKYLEFIPDSQSPLNSIFPIDKFKLFTWQREKCFYKMETNHVYRSIYNNGKIIVPASGAFYLFEDWREKKYWYLSRIS